MYFISFILIFVQSFYFIQQISGHGYLADPPARSSAWITDKDFDQCCRYYNHAEMSCGGTFHQWGINGGKCSICGEAYDLKVKQVSKGGPKYLGKIVRTYSQGANISVTVVLTANHMGIFEFRVCSIDNDKDADATQTCLDLNVLKFQNGLTQFKVERSYTVVQVNVTLPTDLVCKHCVFQWKYKTGNSWGSANGKSCLGCGRENEEFYGCSDIAISSSIETIVDLVTPTTTTKSTTVTSSDVIPPKESTTSPQPSRKCTSTLIFSQSFDINSLVEQYCKTICSNKCASDKIIGNEILYNGCVNTCDKICYCE